jgi:hypothetical protein
MNILDSIVETFSKFDNWHIAFLLVIVLLSFFIVKRNVRQFIDDLLLKSRVKESLWLLIIVLGLTCYLIGFVAIKEDGVYRSLVVQLGNLFTTGVVLGFLTNSDRFLGVFKASLNKVITGEEYIGNRKDLPTYWVRISKHLFKDKFPAISEDLLGIVKNNYFPKEDSSYYESYKIKNDIAWDDDERTIIRLVETITVKLVTHGKDHEFVVHSFINKPNRAEMGSISLRNFYIDNVDVRNERRLKVKNVDYDEANHRTGLEIKIKLKGKETFDLKYVFENRYKYENDHDLSFSASRITKNLTIEVNKCEGMSFDFYKAGTIENFCDRSDANSGEWEYRGIILPKQGYVLHINKTR